MADTFAIIGRLTAELETLNEQYNSLLSVLAGVAAGDISTSRVTVDTEKRSWSLAPIIAEAEKNGEEEKEEISTGDRFGNPAD